MASGKEGRGRASSSSWELLKQPETCTTAMRFIKRIFLNSNLKSRESVCLLNLLWTESVDEFVNWWYFPCDFTQKKIQMNLKRAKMRHYKSREYVQSAHWPDVSGSRSNKINI